MQERLARLRLVLGDEGLAALESATVMVLGLGGVGSACAETLARGGVGSLVLLDRDIVEESNINRQALAYVSTVGRVKADVMAEMVSDINPDCRIIAQQVFLTCENIPGLLDSLPRPDYVLDCIDTVSQKLAIAHWCADRGVPLLASMGAANKLDPTLLEVAPIESTRTCPLSRVMRKECRRRGILGVEVLSSREVPVDVEQRGRSKGESLGSMSYMPPIMGQMMAGLVIRRLAGLVPMAEPPHLVPVGSDAPAARVLDTHHHLDFLPQQARGHALRALAQDDVHVVAQTLTPSAFRELLGDGVDITPRPLLSVGFHPWFIESEEHAEKELAVFADALQRTRFVGEIGLDYSPRRLEATPEALQSRVLRRILEQVKEAAALADPSEPHVLSIHAVRSTGAILDLLAEMDVLQTPVVPVIHWFSGTSNELARLIAAGGYVSVNPHMLAGKRGRALVQQIPVERLLLESDLPAEKVGPAEGMDARAMGEEHARELVGCLTTTLATVSRLHGHDVSGTIARTQERLYGIR